MTEPKPLTRGQFKRLRKVAEGWGLESDLTKLLDWYLAHEATVRDVEQRLALQDAEVAALRVVNDDAAIELGIQDVQLAVTEQRLEAAEGLLDRASAWAIATGHDRRSLFYDILAYTEAPGDD